MFSITPKPIRDEENYIITHGLGYSSFQHYSHGIMQELTVFVPIEENIKINLVKLKNHTDEKRNINLSYYIRPVLGVTDEENAKLLETEMIDDTFLIKNSANIEFKNSTVFMGTSEDIKSYTGDRIEFLGETPNYKMPEALKERLSNTIGLDIILVGQ